MKKGDKIDRKFLLVDPEIRETRRGSEYLTFTLRWPDGEVPAKMWNLMPRMTQETIPVLNGQVVAVVGRMDEWDGKPQIVADTITRTGDDPNDYVPRSKRDVEKMWKELMGLVNDIEDKELQAGTTHLLEMNEYQFKQAPGSSKIHHAYVGGLLQHTLEVVRLARNIAWHLPVKDERSFSLITAIAILHDIGKVGAYDPVTFELTDNGKLLGHLPMSFYLVRKYFQGVVETELLHGILAHHGSGDKGSPVDPQTVEALIVHYADELSSRVAMVNEARVGEDSWTEKIWALGRQFYVGGKDANS